MKKVMQRGFTLIELLVVIAIIGILAAVVLASLNDARDGGQDAAIKQSIGNARSQAELVYNSAGYSYATVCTADTPIDTLMTAAANNRAETTGGAVMTLTVAAADTTVNCHSDASGYAIAAPLNVVSGGVLWCVDSTGYAGFLAALTDFPANQTTCN